MIKKYPQNIFSSTVFLKNTLINIEANMHSIGEKWQFSLDLWNGIFLYKNNSTRNEFKEKC